MSLNLKSRLARWVAMATALLTGGLELQPAPVELVPATAVWRMRPGLTEASTPDTSAWRFPGFVDSTWASGVLPLSYGEGLGGTPITDMQNQYTSYFVRTRFNLSSASAVRRGVLHYCAE